MPAGGKWVGSGGNRTADEFGLEPWITNPVRKKEAKPFMYKGIAISGKIASGKTTLANLLHTMYGIPLVHFAQALKDDVAEALYYGGLAADKDDIIKLYKGDIRGLLQDWGSLFRKVNGEDWWVECLFNGTKPPFIVDDMRYQNEFAACQARGILTVRLQVTLGLQLTRVAHLYPDMKREQLNHKSETDLDNSLAKFDVVVPTIVDTPEALERFWRAHVAGKRQFEFEGGQGAPN